MSERDAALPLDAAPDTVDGLLAAILHLATGQREHEECSFNMVLVLLEGLTEDAENPVNEANERTGLHWHRIALESMWNAQDAHRSGEQYYLPRVNATADATLVNLRAALAALTIATARLPFDYTRLDDTV